MNVMFKKLSAVTAAIIVLNCSAVIASAEESLVSGTWGENISWTIDCGKLTLSGIGEMNRVEKYTNVYHNKFNNADNYADYPWGEYYDVITDVVIEDGITSIAEGAFCYYPELKNVSLSDSVLLVENSAFSCCKNLREITIPENTDIKCYTEFENSAFDYYISTYTEKNSSEMDEFYKEEKANSEAYRLIINGYDYSSSYYYCIENNYLCSYNSIGTAKNPYITPNGSAGSDITWTFSDFGTITFSGSGIVEGKNFDEAVYKIAPYVSKVVFDEGITGIGQMAFVDFEKIEEIGLSNTVSEIGVGAFVTSMNTMHSIIIPKSVEKIGISALCVTEENGKIYGYTDSAAEKYASDSKISFVAIDKILTGDVNGDGVVNLTDATYILKFYAHMSAGLDAEFEPNEQINNILIDIADANDDGKVDIADATLVLETYANTAAGIN